MSTQARFIAYDIEVVALEDLHAGTGLGSAVLDHPFARDAQGHPLLRRSHLRGVWRDAAEALTTLGALRGDLVDTLFGKSGADRGTLICPTLRADRTDGLVWNQTARVGAADGSADRRPADDTLRSTEFVPAGTRFVGRLFLTHATDEIIKAFTAIVRHADCFGGDRTRGAGRVRVKLAPSASTKRTGTFAGLGKHGVRLLVEALEPLEIPRSGVPGNIVDSDSRIPGRMVRGALIAHALDHKAEPATVFTDALAIGDALPLPDSLGSLAPDAMAKITVMPAPRNLRVPKPAALEDNAVPDWARSTDVPGQTWSSAAGAGKRLPEHCYIVRGGDRPAEGYRVGLELVMRNQRGSYSQYDEAPKDSLFSSEQIPARTRFVIDIRPNGSESAAQASWNAMTSSLESTPILRIGRGGAPVLVVSAIPAQLLTHGTAATDGKAQIEILLTSDLSARAANLGHHERLDHAVLCELVDEPDLAARLRTTATHTASRIDRGYNAAIKLPRSAAIVIRAGSICTIEGSQADIAALHDALLARSSLGERTHEGLGRYIIDPNVTEVAVLQRGTTSKPSKQAARNEAVVQLADELTAMLKEKGVSISRSQWGAVRADLECIQSSAAATENVRALFDAYVARAERALGGEVFKVLGVVQLNQTRGIGPILAGKIKHVGWSLDDVRTCVRFIADACAKESERD